MYCKSESRIYQSKQYQYAWDCIVLILILIPPMSRILHRSLQTHNSRQPEYDPSNTTVTVTIEVPS